MEDLRNKSGKIIEIKFKNGLLPAEFAVPGVSNVAQLNGYYRMTAGGSLNEVLRGLSAYDIDDINMHPMNLEDVFMHYYAGGK